MRYITLRKTGQVKRTRDSAGVSLTLYWYEQIVAEGTLEGQNMPSFWLASGDGGLLLQLLSGA
jgi:hypothetical protein